MSTGLCGTLPPRRRPLLLSERRCGTHQRHSRRTSPELLFAREAEES